jgi:hypothetical protein
MKKTGGQLIYEYGDGGIRDVVLKLVKDGKETWAYIYAAGNTYNINIIEKEAMNQDVVASLKACGDGPTAPVASNDRDVPLHLCTFNSWWLHIFKS